MVCVASSVNNNNWTNIAPPPSKKAKRVYYYGVYDAVSSLGDVCTSWDDAQELMAGIKRATGRGGLVKKFTDHDDAQYFSAYGHLSPHQFSPSMSPRGTIIIYTDGSSSMDIASGERRAGFGVFFGPRHFLNVAAPLLSPPLTNNRAELMAIHRALEIIASPSASTYLPSAEHACSVVIFTDSSYSRDALVGSWRELWLRNNFRHGTIQNRDIIEPLWKLIDSFEGRTGRRLSIEWVKGHANSLGNEAADHLAKLGSQRKQPVYETFASQSVEKVSGEQR